MWFTCDACCCFGEWTVLVKAVSVQDNLLLQAT
jgi:hypothetical protein